jgi:poly(3-hydroxybutyrate) depolymerase
MKIRITLALLLACSVGGAQAFCPAAGPANACGNPEFTSCSMPVNGVLRSYCIHIPSQPTNDLPVIFAFHGGNQAARNQVEIWDKHTEQGIVIVAPTALETERQGACSRKWRSLGLDVPTWADYTNADPCPGPSGVGTTKINDLDFVRDLTQGINGALNVSHSYATGFSSGAGFVYQLSITEPFATHLKGFAAISNTINAQQQAAAIGGGVAAYSAATNTRRPIMVMGGTADKINAPLMSIIDTAPSCTFTNTCTAVGANFDCSAVILEGMLCWKNAIVAGGNKHRMITPIAETTRWYVERNGSESNPVVGLYPNRGSYGKAPAESNFDRTTAVRHDYVANGTRSMPVSVIAIMEGGHVMPGKNGDYPPCTNCDIDGTEEILQFWRANAGFRNLWR